jgi:DNA-binding LacI/PurR family transcriptional regulator
MGQVKKIRSFDAAFFIGRQFSSLIDALNFECVPCIVSDTAAPSGYPLTISYQRKKAIKDCADYLAGCGYRRLGLIMNEKRTSNGDWKMAYFQECAETRGVTIKNDKIYCVSENEEDAVKRLLERLPRSKENLPDAFFCEAMTAPLAFLRAAHERGWTVGRDIGLMGYAGETALRNTIPSVTYLRIPYTEMGSEACRLLREKILRKHNDIVHHEIPARIVEGESTRKI